MQERGPVFVTVFNPLAMVIIVIFGSFILAEKLNFGRYISLFFDQLLKRSHVSFSLF